MDTSLKIIKQHLQANLKKLEWKFEQNPNGSTFKFSGLINIRIVITDIESLHLFENITSDLKNSAIFTTSNDVMNVQSSEGQKINSQLTLLKILGGNFLAILVKTIPEESPDSINIKLPNIKDFEELSKVARDIHISLTQIIINKEIKGQTKIISVENGSIWFNVFVGSTAVTVVASLVWSAAVIYKKIQEGKLLEQQVRSLKVKNDSLEDILKAQKTEVDLIIQAEAEYINSQHFKENVPENITRIKNSITTFAELIGKGAEIQPALIAPESVTNLFPDPTRLISIESKIKKLADPTTK